MKITVAVVIQRGVSRIKRSAETELETSQPWTTIEHAPNENDMVRARIMAMVDGLFPDKAGK